jgi:signal transduction histidine kinase
MQETNQLLLEGIPGPLTTKQRRLLELNADGGKRLSAMIVKLLDLSRMEVGITYDFKLHNLVEIMEQAVEEFEARAMEKNISLRMDTRQNCLPLHCDRNRLIQVFENLLENGVKFSPRKSTIYLRMRRMSEYPRELIETWRSRLVSQLPSDQLAVVIVEDNGPGIADPHKEKIFDKFYQVGAKPRKAERGVGLGLAICREIIMAHQGKILVTDNPQGGASFIFAVPCLGDIDASPLNQRIATRRNDVKEIL